MTKCPAHEELQEGCVFCFHALRRDYSELRAEHDRVLAGPESQPRYLYTVLVDSRYEHVLTNVETMAFDPGTSLYLIRDMETGRELYVPANRLTSVNAQPL